jgi:hypothetical protein
MNDLGILGHLDDGRPPRPSSWVPWLARPWEIPPWIPQWIPPGRHWLYKPRPVHRAPYIAPALRPKKRPLGLLDYPDRRQAARKFPSWHPRPRTAAEKARQCLSIQDNLGLEAITYKLKRLAEEAAAARAPSFKYDASPPEWLLHSLETWWYYRHRGVLSGLWQNGRRLKFGHPQKAPTPPQLPVYYGFGGVIGRPRKANKLSNAQKQRAYRPRKKHRSRN